MDEIEKIAVSDLLRYLWSNRCIVHSSYTAVFSGKGHSLQLPLVQTGPSQRVFGKPQILSFANAQRVLRYSSFQDSLNSTFWLSIMVDAVDC